MCCNSLLVCLRKFVFFISHIPAFTSCYILIPCCSDKNCRLYLLRILNNFPFRTKEICWKFVARYFLEVIGCIFYVAFILEQFLLPLYHDFGLPNHHNMPLYKMLVVGVFGSVIPAVFVLVLMWYCLLHAWMNACAELMHFADRMFYKVRIIVTTRQCCCHHTDCFRDSKQI